MIHYGDNNPFIIVVATREQVRQSERLLLYFIFLHGGYCAPALDRALSVRLRAILHLIHPNIYCSLVIVQGTLQQWCCCDR